MRLLCAGVAGLAIAFTAAGSAAADDGDAPLYACAPASAKTSLTVNFKPDVSVAELAVWVAGFTCESVVIAPDVAKHATRLQIIAPAPMTPKQAVKLFVNSLEAAGLKVRHKDRTFTISLGPGMPRTCPDLVTTGVDPAGGGVTAEASPPLDVDRLADQVAAGIRRIDDTHAEVPRAIVEQVLANPMAFSRGARVLPASRDGTVIGFRLYAIRPSSVYGQLGFKNGDIVTAINGKPLDSLDHALDAYTTLRTADRADLTLVRRGKPATLSIVIRP